MLMLMQANYAALRHLEEVCLGGVGPLARSLGNEAEHLARRDTYRWVEPTGLSLHSNVPDVSGGELD